MGDPLESAYLVAWNARQVAGGPEHYWDLNIFFPVRGAMAFTDHRFLPSVLAAPALWASGNPVLAYNVAVFIGLLLAALAGRRLGLALGLEAVGAWAAGALYAFHTNQIHETPRLHVIFHAFLALALEQLVILLATGRRIAAWAAAGFLLLQGLSSNYMLLYGALLVGLVLGGVAIVRPRRAWEGGRQLILPAVAAAAAFLPVALPYARQTAVHDLGRALPVGFDLLHLLQPLKSNVLYGPLFSELAPSGRVGFVGFFAAALAAYALLAGRVPTPSPGWIPARVWVPAAAALAAVFGILALGRDVALAGEMIGPGPYRLLYAWVPGFDRASRSG